MDHDSVEDSLAAHTQMERLTGENQYFCDGCRCKVDAIKMTRFEELPPILTLSLSRFYFDSKLMQSVKLEKRCSFPFVLDMSGYFTDKTHRTAKYDLFSVVLHVGGSTGGGHYHAFIKDPYGTISERINDSTSASELNGSNKCRVPIGSSIVQRTAKTGLGNKNDHTQLPDAMSPQPYPNDHPSIQTSSMDFGIIGSELENKASVCGHKTGSVVLQHSSATICKSSSDVDAGNLVPRNMELVNWKQNPGSLLSPPAMRPLFHSDTARISGIVFADRSKRHDLRCIDTFGSNVSRALLSKAPNNPKLDTTSVLAAYMRQSLATDVQSFEVNRHRLKTSDSAEHGRPKVNQNQRGKYRSGQDLKNKKGISGLSKIHSPLKQNTSKVKVTDAVSIRGVQPSDVKNLDNFRSRSAHRNRGNLKPASRKGCSKHNTPVTLCSVRSKTRNNSTLTDCGAYSTGLLPEGSIPHTLPALQTAQHNSALGRHISSYSSSSSTSSSPVAHRRMESLHSSTAHRSFSPLWHSKLFDGSPSLEAQGSHSTGRINTSKTDSDLGRHCTHQAQKANERIIYPDSQPPGDGSLDAIPFMQRTKARYPSQMSMSVGSIRDTTHLKAIHYSSLEEQSSCHLECQQILVDEQQRTPEKNERSMLSAQLHTENLRPNALSERNLPEVQVGRWFDVNDDYITEVDPESFQRVFEGPECAYMLFYRLMGLAIPVNPIAKND
ncbi:ubiquitin carboxyl-terminal hydrolase 40 [Clonorchis sinensis]|uniref:Ubiquitin carboxyl-terminal hydrolase 40 n=2 Tax=Clonorchis sinensis TaxID=79923 RepID=G7YLT6_CLOSI|nr:ubiquitin carboxyl-terminal hydrolase 40 [Clonorchis sinensis]